MKADIKKITNFALRPESPTKRWITMAALIFAVEKDLIEDPQWKDMFGETVVNELKQFRKKDEKGNSLKIDRQ